MSYTYGDGHFNRGATHDIGTPGWAQTTGSFSQEDHSDYLQPSGPSLTSHNLLLNVTKEECDLLDPQRSLQHELLMNGIQVVKTEGDVMAPSFAMSTGSDKSSPSIKLGNDDSYGNNNIYSGSEQDLAAKRKAQNRAAQRAFRERKEMKLKELEDKLTKSETDNAELQKQLEKLQKQNIVISTENKLLQKSGGSAVLSTVDPSTSSFSFPSEEPLLGKYYKSEKQLQNPQIPYESKRLTIPETWEYLMEKDDPRINIEDVLERVKGLEVCHRHGPAYPLSLIDDIIREYLV
ncbi:bZIP transcription factor CYBJADRAFT_166191 [Cyberlindnera jadinii NRRL Y-1542]|uniref:BZIP domain-containing protein n=1 Tax=Cyberlindnera jadinii (strain ATCC 18201 / CBS 1600 / BCRC 20928 / JCM 3617 / NBRC 0987 / NRRL Y-1542) TaxID=983966 RepID=A0A1E4S7K8_CYBJN|nr:hypothetical protein CYBJADRAFT_166191 [Cyberlindnera jadinii NRRL Y-1542]ODV75458.1 hypothetical protein CYBJADRAFT_166191 [Cyberlindnera jadinii NRRL Y-1542]